MTRVARWLATRDSKPPVIAHSPANRTRQTASIVAQAVGVPLAERADLGANANAQDLLPELTVADSATMFVSHQPLLDALVLELLGDEQRRSFATASLALLERVDGRWRLHYWMTPDDVA